MILSWRNIEEFYLFDSDPRFYPFLLYVRCKSGVTFVRRCFRDVCISIHKAFTIDRIIVVFFLLWIHIENFDTDPSKAVILG